MLGTNLKSVSPLSYGPEHCPGKKKIHSSLLCQLSSGEHTEIASRVAYVKQTKAREKPDTGIGLYPCEVMSCCQLGSLSWICAVKHKSLSLPTDGAGAAAVEFGMLWPVKSRAENKSVIQSKFLKLCTTLFKKFWYA